ncbi:MAG: formyl transferase [Pseudomonadales bacterium]|nr:formyl transferase [Pseudomonadales bacterium]
MAGCANFVAQIESAIDDYPVNITILANKDLASCLAINYLLQDLEGHRLTVFLSSRVGSKRLEQPLQQLKLIEQELPNEVFFPLLLGIASESPTLLGFPQISQRLEGRLSELNTINQPEGMAQFVATEPELVLSIRYGVILKDPVLAVPKHGVLNLHSGRLPDYKGVMATFWALLNGEKSIGTTLHTIDDSTIDTGRIVAETTMAVESTRSYLWHVLQLYEAGCAAMSSAVADIAAGRVPDAKLQRNGGNYFSFPEAEELEAFFAKGWRLFDSNDVIDLYKRFLPPR